MTPAIQIQTENRPQPAPVPEEPLLAAEEDGILVLSRAEAEARSLNLTRIFKKMTPFPENMAIPRLLLSLDLGAQCWHAALLSAKHTGRHAFRGMGKPEHLLAAVRREMLRLGIRETRDVVACHEIGRDGLWVRDWLVAHGIACVVFSPDVLSGNSKTVKTDKVDAARLAVRLRRFFDGELECDHVHLPPSAECREGRALSRERQFAVAERTRHGNRFLSILARHKEVPPRLDIRKVDVDALRDQLGEPLPPGEVEALRMARRRYLAADADAEDARRRMAKALAGEAKKEKARAKAGGEAAPASPPGLLAMALKLTRLNGIGLRTAWVLVHELFHKEFRNTGQVSSATGLVAVPRSSGTASRCGGVSKRSNGPLRGACVEAAWLWLRHQPGSAVSRWFDGRTAQGVSARRMRKVAIVAVARKLAVALWKYLALDIMPEGAVRTGA